MLNLYEINYGGYNWSALTVKFFLRMVCFTFSFILSRFLEEAFDFSFSSL
jgi:hypothetical protein